jgi:hypothetical protein
MLVIMKARPSSLLVALLGVASLAPTTADAQLLRGASRVVRTGSSRAAEPAREPSRRRSSGGGGVVGVGPRARHSPCGARVMPYPYAYGFVRGWNWASHRRCWWQPVETVGVADPSVPFTRVVLGAEAGWAVPSAGRAALAARFDLGVFEFAVRYAALFERVEGQIDTVTLGRVDVGFRVVDLADVDARIRLGLNHWIDAAGHNFGFAGGLAVDVFPGAPWVLSAEVGGGSLGQAGIVQARATAGVMFGLVELGLGWDHTTLLTDDGSPSVHLTGPIAITRFWL